MRKDLKVMRESALSVLWGRTFYREGTVRAKARRQEGV